ncbi:MAG: protein kinase, partial [Pseudomonadota bacterium]|nr:protein kinase [Pseudomonadota bacterium]
MIEGYSVQEELFRSKQRSICRGVRDSDQAPVIIKSLLVGIATEEDVAAVKHEFDILSTLSVEGVPKPFGLESDANGLNLILEDRRGSRLSNYIRTSSFDLATYLDIAIGIADVLGEIHRQHVVHKDINPSNVLVDSTGAVALIDFNISTLHAEEYATVSHPTRLEGTLAYISPEQTGRMNRPVDYRSDLYSLGVTLYELFTGELPFKTVDPMELVYCHIAVPPSLPDEIRSDLPGSVSAVICKLLEKAPEDRYQSASGLVHDLRLCRHHLHKVPKEFQPGCQDARDRFSIPGKVYGREDGLLTLMTAFDRASQGGVELVLVSGYSGIGKSALVNAVQTPVTERHGYYVSGKFDQLRLTVPYSAIVAALSDLVAQLLTEPDDALMA